MKSIEAGQIVWKKVVTIPAMCTCSPNCNNGATRFAIAKLETIVGGFIADYEEKELDYGNVYRKGRIVSARVLEITDLKTDQNLDTASSGYRSSFKYNVGEVVYVDNFDTKNIACSYGIHCFETEQQAKDYDL